MQRITQDQLNQIVAEVQRLANRTEDQLDRQQVEEILEDLHLPVELLDDAMIQLSRKQALATQQKRNFFIGSAIVVGLIITIATTSIWLGNRQENLANISVSQDRLTLVQDNGDNLTTIPRQINSEVFYRVTLQDAPIGERLTLQCDWIDPNGNIAHQNRYQTKQIDTPVWQTHCRIPIGLAATPGNWQVRMYHGDRLLSEASFTVK